MGSPTEHELLTADEVAAIFRTDPVTVYRWARAVPPKIKSVKVGGVVRFRRDEINRILDSERAS